MALLLTGTGYAVEAARWRRRRELDAVRARIASDLHDDLGASLSRISILPEVAARRARDDASPLEIVERIGEASRSVVEKLADGIWAVDPRRDDLRSLGERLRLVAAELLEPAGISWRVEVPEEAERIGIHPDQRRQVYLVLKEAMANAARHSSARNVSLSTSSAHGILELELKDDGLGFDERASADGARLSGGRGLANMRERASAFGATFRIESAPGKGTVIGLRVRVRPPA
jgi:signal transduction histidine kinase